MKLTWVAFLGCVAVLGSASDGQAGAIAIAAGHVADDSTPAKYEPGLIKATAEQTSPKLPPDDLQPEDYYYALAVVNGAHLGAFAEASIKNPGIQAEGRATATWSDVLTANNLDIIASPTLSAVPYLYFRPQATGEIFRSGRAELHVSLFNELTGEFLAEASQSMIAEASDSNVLLEAPMQISMFSMFGPVSYSMTLKVAASGEEPGEYIADFSHTAILPTLFIGDQNGKPIPELAGVNFEITGSSGLSYAVTTVPEPATLVLAVPAMFGVVLLTIFHKPRKFQAIGAAADR